MSVDTPFFREGDSLGGFDGEDDSLGKRKAMPSISDSPPQANSSDPVKSHLSQYAERQQRDILDFKQEQQELQQNDIVHFRKANAKGVRDDALSWEDYADAAWTGAAHGVTTYGPETIYRAIKTMAAIGGNVFDTSGISQWASEGIQEQLRERELDPWYRPDPRWMRSDWGYSLYNGFSSAASSLMVAVPAAATSAGVAALGTATAPGTAGASIGSLLFSGTSYVVGSGASAGVFGLAAYDQFLDEAYAAAKAEDPNVRYEDVVSDKFWYAILEGASETGTEFGGDLLGAKLAKVLPWTKPAIKSVQGIFARAMNNIINNAAVNVGTEAANAGIQHWIREVNDMTDESRVEAVRRSIGPAIVAGGIGGVHQSVISRNETTPSITDVETQLRQITAIRKRAALSPEAALVMDRLSANTGDYGKSAFESALLVDAQAKRIAGETQQSLADLTMKANTTTPEFQSMLQALQNPDASFSEVVANSMGQLESLLSEDSRLGLWEFFTAPEGEVNNVAALESFQDYLNDPAKAVEKWNLPEAVQESFTGMSNILDDSIAAFSADSSVRPNPAAADYLNQKKPQAAPQAGMRFKEADVNAVYDRWKDKDLSDPANQQAFLADALPHMQLDLTGAMSDDPATVFRDTYLAYKPLLDRIIAKSDRKPNSVAQENAEKLLSEKPGMEIFANTFKAVDGVDDKQAAINAVLDTSWTHIKTLAKMIADSGNSDINLEYQARQLGLNHILMASLDKGIGTEEARALAMRRNRKFTKDDPQFAEKMLAVLSSDGSKDMRDAMWAKIANSDSIQEFQEDVKVPLATRYMDAAMELWTSNMLTNPSTHTVNALSNTIQLFAKTAERGLATHFLPHAADGVQSGETAVMINGFWKALGELRTKWKTHRDGSDGLVEAIRTSENMWENQDDTKAADVTLMRRAMSSERLGLSKEHGRISGGLATMVDLLGKVTHVPFALLNHSDQIFKYVYKRAEIDARIWRDAQGDSQKFNELLKNVPKDYVSQAEENAKVLMFQGDLGKVGQWFNQGRNVFPPLRFFVPFLKTPINVFKEGVSYTPIVNRYFGKIKQQLNSPDTVTRQLAEGHIMLGNLIWSSALLLASNGFLTGPGPEDIGQRKRLEAGGWLPNSLKLGDSYYQLDRLDPLAMIFNMAGHLSEMGDYIDQDDMEKATVMGIGQATRILTSRTYMESLQDLIELVQTPEKGIPDLKRRLSFLFMPIGSLGRAINRNIDPYQREVNTFMDGLLQTAPGGSFLLHERRDFFGKKMESRSYLGPSLFSPFQTSTDTDDPVYREIARLQKSGVSSAPIPGKYLSEDGERVQMTPDEYRQFLDIYANKVKVKGSTLTAMESLRELIDSEKYTSLANDKLKGKAIATLLRKYSTAARKEMRENSLRIQKILKRKHDRWDFLTDQ